jgi:hypothetical protein
MGVGGVRRYTEFITEKLKENFMALRVPMQCPLVLLVIHRVNTTSTSQLTLYIKNHTEHKYAVWQHAEKTFRSLELVQGWDIVTGL